MAQKVLNGGKVHELRPHVLHLLRGQVYDIQGKRFFTFGGAASHDTGGIIIDPEDDGFIMMICRIELSI